MRKIIWTPFLRALSFILILSITSAPINGFSMGRTSNPEIDRAISLGIVKAADAKNLSKPVSGKQFCLMLEKTIGLNDKKAVRTWKKVAEKGYKDNKSMLRQDGMLAVLYAAKTMGIAKYNKGNLSDEKSIVYDEIWEKVLNREHPMFPNWESELGISWDKKVNHMIGAVLFSMRRTSKLSSLSVFDINKGGDLRVSEKMTYREAIIAAVRLHDSTLSQKQADKILENSVSTEFDKEFLKKVETRKDTIMSSKTEVTVTGKMYYVSNSGNDANDGLTERSAWATLDKVNQTEFAPGDGVFFERKGLWRGHLKAQSGMTYSAYGSGEKPLIYGSPENGADPKKWKLINGSDSIWEFYIELPACATLVFNKDEKCAIKELPSLVNGKYVLNTDQSMAFDIIKELDQNLEFFSEADKYASIRKSEPKAKLYLRCENGNPGNVFNSIEFLAGTDSANCWSMKDITFDNLHFKYSGECGIAGGGDSSNIKVQNCAIGYTGGVVIAYTAENYGMAAGDGIRIDGTNNSALNNYVYQIYDYGMTCETGDFLAFFGDNTPQRNITYKGNLIEKCSGGLCIVNWDQNIDPNNLIENTRVEDNYFILSGEGWGYKNHFNDNNFKEDNDIDLGIGLSFFEVPNANAGIYITNNVFYMNRGRMIWGNMAEKYKPIFSGNTYVQSGFGMLAKWKPTDKQSITNYGNLLDNSELFIKDIIRDESGKLIIK